MDKIHFGFAYNKGWFVPVSWLIRLLQSKLTWKPFRFSLGPYSHTYVRVYNSFIGRWMYFDATGKGVKVKNDEEFKNSYVVVKEYAFDMSPEAKRSIYQWVFDLQGVTGYGYGQIVWIALLKLCWIPLGFKMPDWVNNDDKRLICNEMSALIYEKVTGTKVPGDLDTKDLIWFDKLLESVKQ